MKRHSSKKSGSSSYHALNCKYCGDIVNRCDINAVKVTCFKCTHQLAEGNRLEQR